MGIHCRERAPRRARRGVRAGATTPRGERARHDGDPSARAEAIAGRRATRQLPDAVERGARAARRRPRAARRRAAHAPRLPARRAAVRALVRRARARARRRSARRSCAATWRASPRPALAPATCARKLASLRALFESPREHGLIAQNPADLVATPRRAAHLPRVLSAREAARLLDGIPAGGARWRRATGRCSSSPTRAACAPRRSSRCALEDVDHDAEQLRVEGKGRKTRFVPVGEPAMAALRAYLERAGRRSRGRSGGAGGGHGARCSSAKTGRGSARATCAGGCAAGPCARGDRAARLIAARAAPQLRDAPARRRRRPALDPGAARPRERVEHPDLHSGRVRQAYEAPTRAATLGPDTGGGKTLETNVKPIELRELWRRYKTEGDDRVRERLVVAYSPLVKYVAGRTAAGPAAARRGGRPDLLRPGRA